MDEQRRKTPATAGKEAGAGVMRGGEWGGRAGVDLRLAGLMRALASFDPARLADSHRNTFAAGYQPVRKPRICSRIDLRIPSVEKVPAPVPVVGRLRRLVGRGAGKTGATARLHRLDCARVAILRRMSRGVETGDYRAAAGIGPAAQVRRNSARGGHGNHGWHSSLPVGTSKCDQMATAQTMTARMTAAMSADVLMPHSEARSVVRQRCRAAGRDATPSRQ